MALRRKDSKAQRIKEPTIIETGGLPRSGRNMLKPYGIAQEAWLKEGWTPKPTYPSPVKEAAAPCILLGETNQRRLPVFSPDGCFPDMVGALVAVEGGIRRLQADEMAKAKGVPEEWIRQERLNIRNLNQLTDIHIWGAIAASLSPQDGTLEPHFSQPTDEADLEKQLMTTSEDGINWEWMPPDLSPGGKWHTERLQKLYMATEGHPEADRLRQEGMEALKIHRRNYEDDGEIKQLQILWWEFPPEHWEELRDGCPMNFLTQPTKGISPNAPMTAEQADIATEFIDKLWRIGVFELIPEGSEMRANAPLFTVPKPGQPGQWRVIADMKNGGQNDHIGKDPVHLPQAEQILEKLYTGGWSAIVDTSKFFHNFPTHPHDRPYLGCIHPKTGQRLWYLGLPMGSSQSPSLACRYGLSMLRSLVEQEPVFQGVITENSWRTRLSTGHHQPELGTGLVRIGMDGLPAALIWGFVDDFKVHAPTKEKLITALNTFMDLALRLGLICQKVKTKAPAQIQKYCGFLYDTTGIPTLRIPEEKRSRALAMIRYLKAGDKSIEMSCLALAVVTGLLQSMVEATPQRMGQTFLRRLHD